MTNNNSKSNFIFSASERELLTLSMSEIINGLMADYKSFSKGIEEGIRIPDSKQEPRMSHSCILYAEGLRLAYSHLELAKKLILASLFDFVAQANYWLAIKESALKAKNDIDLIKEIEQFNHYTTRAIAWLDANGEAKQFEDLLKAIKDFEDWKTEERRKEEERKKKEEEERLRLLGKIK